MPDTSAVKFSPIPLSDSAALQTEEGNEDDFYFLTGAAQPPVDLSERSSDELCGLGSWRPNWLQKFANHRVYAIAFIIVGVVQGMTYTYFNGVITTMEKTFAVPSSKMGFILSGNDISQILCGVLVTHIASRGSRPLWLAIGITISASSCFLYASAQLFYDPQTYQNFENNSLPNATEHHHVMCSAGSDLNATQDMSMHESFCATRPSSIPALTVFFIGQFISGIGSTALFTLGFTYMDDGVKKSSFPLYMTFTSALRSLGPTIGFVLASACLKIYIQPSENPEYNQKDVRWLGAWWLGFIIIGLIQLLITFPIALFPKQLPKPVSKKRQSVLSESEIPAVKATSPWKDLLASCKRMIKNPVVVFQLMCTGPIILGMIGFSVFLPKYLEAQFGQTPSQASIFTGTSSMLMMMIGTIVGGLLVWKFQPSAFCICCWGAVSDILYAIGIFTIMNFKCQSVAFFGVNFEGGGLEVTSPCGQDCGCDNKFDPICVDGTNYLSPCLAGCSSAYRASDTTTFLDCTCTATSFINTTVSMISNYSAVTTGKTGYCPGSRGNCGYFWPYIIILASLKLIASSTRIGGMLVLLRSVDKRDKAIGMALWGAIASLLGFIPGPIIYGAVVDSTCLLWGVQPCGAKGNCWLYDLDSLRYWFHGITIASFIIASGCDVVTALFTREMNLYSEQSGRVLTYKEGFSCRTQLNTTTTTTTTNDNLYYNKNNPKE